MRAKPYFGDLQCRFVLICAVVFVSVLATVESPVWAQRRQQKIEDVTVQQVRGAIQHGVTALKKSQGAQGNWPQFSSFKGGVTAIAALSILNATDNPDDPAVKKAIDYLTSIKIEKNYCLSLRIMLLASVDPAGKRYLRAVQTDVDRLLTGQGPGGGFSYIVSSQSKGDASNSQFALLALHEASRMGIIIPDKAWEKCRRYWEACSTEDGGFSYLSSGGSPATRTMTSAGISSTIIVDENYPDLEKLINGGRAKCCSEGKPSDRVDQALRWLGSSFSILGARDQGRTNRLFYYLYGLERAGRLSGRRFFGQHDWYREGSSFLVKNQNTTGYWGSGGENQQVSTAMALLFLSKGKRPVVLGKYLFENGEDEFHRSGVHYLTRNLEDSWKQKLNWQEVKGLDASVNDLLQTPVLFMSGKRALKLRPEQKTKLKKYIENGGFLFAEACQGDGCGAADFDRSFRDLMKELFPDSALEALPANHPVWSAVPGVRLDRPDEKPLLGLQACCRTSVIYCPSNLSCYWNIDRPGIQRRLKSKELLRRIKYATQVGINVVTYATGRNVKEKDATPKLEGRAKSVLTSRALEFPKMVHSGGWDEAPNAWKNIQKRFSGLEVSINFKKLKVEPENDQLKYPFVFMHGRSSFTFTEEQREDIRIWLEKKRGFLFADSICSSKEFTESFLAEMKIILGKPLRPIPENHLIWSERVGFPINKVTLRKRVGGGEFVEETTRPQLLGAEIDDRLVVVFSPNDLSCALEGTTASQCEGYLRDDAERIGVNVLLYRLLVE